VRHVPTGFRRAKSKHDEQRGRHRIPQARQWMQLRSRRGSLHGAPGPAFIPVAPVARPDDAGSGVHRPRPTAPARSEPHRWRLAARGGRGPSRSRCRPCRGAVIDRWGLIASPPWPGAPLRSGLRPDGLDGADHRGVEGHGHWYRGRGGSRDHTLSPAPLTYTDYHKNCGTRLLRVNHGLHHALRGVRTALTVAEEGSVALSQRRGRSP
jgi:hypothetical protein